MPDIIHQHKYELWLNDTSKDVFGLLANEEELKLLFNPGNDELVLTEISPENLDAIEDAYHKLLKTEPNNSHKLSQKEAFIKVIEARNAKYSVYTEPFVPTDWGIAFFRQQIIDFYDAWKMPETSVVIEYNGKCGKDIECLYIKRDNYKHVITVEFCNDEGIFEHTAHGTPCDNNNRDIFSYTSHKLNDGTYILIKEDFDWNRPPLAKIITEEELNAWRKDTKFSDRISIESVVCQTGLPAYIKPWQSPSSLFKNDDAKQ